MVCLMVVLPGSYRILFGNYRVLKERSYVGPPFLIVCGQVTTPRSAGSLYRRSEISAGAASAGTQRAAVSSSMPPALPDAWRWKNLARQCSEIDTVSCASPLNRLRSKINEPSLPDELGADWRRVVVA
jgi:hypothetical protein